MNVSDFVRLGMKATKTKRPHSKLIRRFIQRGMKVTAKRNEQRPSPVTRPVPSAPIVEYIPPPPDYSLIPPLPPAQARAAEEGDQARERIEEKVQKMYKHPDGAIRHAPRALNCGKVTLLLGRDNPLGKGVENMLMRTSCGRSDCPHCWRKRLTRAYRRPVCALLTDRDSNQPRIEPVHVAEVSWLGWESFDRSIRRQHGGDVGRLRVRRRDNTVLVVCDRPFRGSRAVSPADALDMVSKSIDDLHTAKHSLRLLGDWSAWTEPKEPWHLLHRTGERINFAIVTAHLNAMKVRVKAFNKSDTQGLFWRSDSEATAEQLLRRLVEQGACPSLTIGEDQIPLRTNSDTDAEREAWLDPDRNEAGAFSPFY